MTEPKQCLKKCVKVSNNVFTWIEVAWTTIISFGETNFILIKTKQNRQNLQVPYSLYYSPDSIRVLSRIQSRKLKLLINKKFEYNPNQKIQKINRVPDCNTDLKVFGVVPKTWFFRNIVILKQNHQF